MSMYEFKVLKKSEVIFLVINFENAKFTTVYSFDSARSIIRSLSDAFSKEFCDTVGALRYAAVKTEGKCLYCGKPMYEKKNGVPVFSNTIHYDHVYPASKLNLFEVGNIAIACSTCNLAKSDRLPMEYYDIRAAEDTPRLFYIREEFEKFLDNYTKPYQEKWPEHFAAGSRNVEDDEEFKDLLTKLLYDRVSISHRSSKYNHLNSVNKEIWDKVVKRALDSYSPTTAKDVEARIGYTNSIFETVIGHDTAIEDCTMKQLAEFSSCLLMSKFDSKNEIQKYRMLLKMLTEVLNEDLMKGQLDDFYKSVPTYSTLVNSKKS